LVRSLMDEVFGSENAVSTIALAKTTGSTGAFLSSTIDFIVWYSKDKEHAKYNQLYKPKEIGGQGSDFYSMVETEDGNRRSMTAEEQRDPSVLPAGSRVFSLNDLTSQRVRENRTGYFPIEYEGRTYLPRSGEWKTNPDGIKKLLLARRIRLRGETLRYVRYIEDF